MLTQEKIRAAADRGMQIYDRLSGSPSGLVEAAGIIASMLAVLEEFEHDGRLQTFQDRERFRAEVRSIRRHLIPSADGAVGND